MTLNFNGCAALCVHDSTSKADPVFPQLVINYVTKKNSHGVIALYVFFALVLIVLYTYGNSDHNCGKKQTKKTSEV